MEVTPSVVEERSPWRDRLIGSLPLVIGFLAFEITANPAVGIAVACLKFGWEDFLTAIWLRRVDPDRSRGRTCFWFHAALGFGKTAAVGFVLSNFGILLYLCLFPRRQFDVLIHQAGGALLAEAVGGVCFLVTSYIAIGSAIRRGVKVWVDPDTYRARRDHTWPPRSSRIRGNRVKAIIVSACLLTWLASFGGIMLWFDYRGVKVERGSAAATILLFSFYLQVAVVVWIVRALNKRGAASTPQECWPELPSSST